MCHVVSILSELVLFQNVYVALCSNSHLWVFSFMHANFKCKKKKKNKTKSKIIDGGWENIGWLLQDCIIYKDSLSNLFGYVWVLA